MRVPYFLFITLSLVLNCFPSKETDKMPEMRLLFGWIGKSNLTDNSAGNNPVSDGSNSSSLQFSIGGTITGLTQSGLVLKNNSESLTITTGSNSFQFLTKINSGSMYNVSIDSQPTSSIVCKLINGSGDASTNITNINITCQTPITIVDGNFANGLNKNAANQALAPFPFTFNSNLYITLAEASKIRVIKYNGNDSAPSWSFVDGNGTNGINYNPASLAETPKAIVYNNELYLTWAETNGNNVIRVLKYNGNDASPSWTSAAYGNNPDTLNYTNLRDARTPILLNHNSNLISAWTEASSIASPNTQQVRMSKYGSPTWSFMDGNIATGISVDIAKQAFELDAIVFNSGIYYAYEENFFQQLRVLKHNGNTSSPNWMSVDGGGTTGINKNTSQLIYRPNFAVYNNSLYITWYENNGSKLQTRVANTMGMIVLPHGDLWMGTGLMA